MYNDFARSKLLSELVFYYPSDFFFEIIVVDLIFLNLFKWHLMFYGTGINLLNQVNSQDTII